MSRYGSWPICRWVFFRSFSKYIIALRWRKWRCSTFFWALRNSRARWSNGPADCSPSSLQLDRFLGPEPGQQQIVVQGEILAEGAGVALPAAAPDQLAVDAAGVVHLGADHVQPAELLHAVAKLDVGAAAGHVRRDGHLAAQPGAGDDVGLFGDVVGVEHLMLDPVLVRAVSRGFPTCRSSGCRSARAGLRRASRRLPRQSPPISRRRRRKRSVGNRWRMAGRLVGIGMTWQR